MKRYLVYTAGPILGTSYAGSVDWRSYVDSSFPEYIQAVSPMRGKDYLAKEKVIQGSYEEHPLSSQKGIMTRDHMDVSRCDLVLANFLGATKVSIGTVMEIAWAYELKKPVVLVMEKDNVHNHPMIREAAGFIVDNLDEAINISILVLSPTV